MEIYTNAMLKDWQTCKNKYFYKYIKKIYIPQNEEYFELGRSVHALISYKMNGFDTRIVETNASEEILEHYKSVLKHHFFNQNYFLTEWGFQSRIGSTTDLFIGRIDAVFYDKKNNHYNIADWKTGMKIPENPVLDRQAQIYLYSFYNAKEDLGIDLEYEDLSFTFVQTPSLNESTLTFSKDLYEKFEEDFIKTIKEIKSYKFEDEYEENKNCKFCEYNYICKFN